MEKRAAIETGQDQENVTLGDWSDLRETHCSCQGYDGFGAGSARKKMLAPMQADKAGGQRHRDAEASGAELIALSYLSYLAIREIAPENRVTQACS